MVGFYLLGEQALILRILAVLAGVAASIAVAWFTEPGQRFFVFAREACRGDKESGLAVAQGDHADNRDGVFDSWWSWRFFG